MQETSAAMKIGSHFIGEGHPCFVIAEAGVNHDGSFEKAVSLIKAAAAAGVDAVKFQWFRAESLASQHAPKADYQRKDPLDTTTQFEMLRALELTKEHFSALAKICHSYGLLFLASPFGNEEAASLSALGVPAFKIASGELTNFPLLDFVAGQKKPVILSTGMATLEEVEEALFHLSCVPVALLHAVSRYPAPAEVTNLRAIDTLRSRFSLPVGFSDHSEGIEVALAAVARGACILEKHFTLDKKASGPDHAASLDPLELKSLVKAVRKVESALGDGIKIPAPGEKEISQVARRSLIAKRSIPRGKLISADDLCAKRPGTGISPGEIDRVLKLRARSPIEEGQLLEWESLE